MKLSPEMQKAVDYANAHGGALWRHPGGFWSHEAWRQNDGGPTFGTSTVNALVTRGAATYTEHKKGRNGEFPVKATMQPNAKLARATAPHG